jgi:hypothetical protein
MRPLQVGDKIRRNDRAAEDRGWAKGTIQAIIPNEGNNKNDKFIVVCVEGSRVPKVNQSWVNSRTRLGFKDIDHLVDCWAATGSRGIFEETWELVDDPTEVLTIQPEAKNSEIKRQLNFFSQDLQKGKRGPSGLLFP